MTANVPAEADRAPASARSPSAFARRWARSIVALAATVLFVIVGLVVRPSAKGVPLPESVSIAPLVAPSQQVYVSVDVNPDSPEARLADEKRPINIQNLPKDTQLSILLSPSRPALGMPNSTSHWRNRRYAALIRASVPLHFPFAQGEETVTALRSTPPQPGAPRAAGPTYAYLVQATMPMPAMSITADAKSVAWSQRGSQVVVSMPRVDPGLTVAIGPEQWNDQFSNVPSNVLSLKSPTRTNADMTLTPPTDRPEQLQLQGGQAPAIGLGLRPETWHWSGLGGETASFTDEPGARNDENRLFIAGLVLGVAGAAALTLLMEFLGAVLSSPVQTEETN